MTLHAQLVDAIVHHCGERLAQPPQLTQDALTLEFDSGMLMQLRFASAEEYSIHWRFGDRELRIDTAPLHPQLASFPNHLHDADGVVRADTLTQPGRAPWENLRAVLDSLLGDAAR
jgi:hypothetical protein